MNKERNIIIILLMIAIAVGVIAYDESKRVSDNKPTKIVRENAVVVDVKSDKYYQCYGALTQRHKASGLHDRNRQVSIKIKEEVCTLYSQGKAESY